MKRRKGPLLVVLVAAFFGMSEVIQADLFRARDPGVRGGPAGGGGPIAGLTADEAEMFTVGLEDFSEEEGVDRRRRPALQLRGVCGLPQPTRHRGHQPGP